MSEFEQSLFAEGAFDWSNEDIFGDVVDRFDIVNSRNADRRAIMEFLDYGYWLTQWRFYYRGKIPASWHFTANISYDLETAKDKAETLSDVLIEAALTHPDDEVAVAVGINQKLKPSEIAILFARKIPESDMDDVYLYQLDFGLTDEEWTEAKTIAEQESSLILCLQEENLVPIAFPVKQTNE